MCDFNVNETFSCSSGEGLSSLMNSLKILFAFFNELECNNCPVFRTTKSLQVPNFIAFEISSRYC